MVTLAAQMTASHPSAIAAICLMGPDAHRIVTSIFKPANPSAILQPSAIVLGNIIENDTVIDEVVVACENDNLFFIDCHGNSLIIENICRLAARAGATLTDPSHVISELSKSHNADSVTIEARLAQLKTQTVAGYKLINNQPQLGLGPLLKTLQDSTDLDSIRSTVLNVLNDSAKANYIIHGCRIVLAGPPNSGKSTLLNALCGRPASIVSEIAGTTRDYVTDTCSFGPLCAELVDTAGIDITLTGENIDRQAQDFSKRMIDQADLVIFVTDAAKPHTHPAVLAGKTVIHIFNKIDLLKNAPPAGLAISAKTGQGLGLLTDAILSTLKIKNFDLQTPVCFTNRQKRLFDDLRACHSLPHAKQIITELLCGTV